MKKKERYNEILHTVISVESRKGGVGKTTAALCLAKLFKQKGREVLLLDTDITGTNVIDALDSAFWKDHTCIVEEIVDGEKTNQSHKKANLLKLFERGFMAGKGIPCFKLPNQTKDTSDLTFKKNLINVIGSEIYDDRAYKLICKPSILFDELHAFWFAQYLSEICKQFRESVGINKSTAIIIDNSPGYVGIGPVIQEWLLDEGVDNSKFLFVSSLDQQDLTACLKAMEYLHKTYSDKWAVAKELYKQNIYYQNKNKRIQKKDQVSGCIKNNMKFVMRLLDIDKSSQKENELDFYIERGLSKGNIKNDMPGDTFEKQVEKYQGIVVNRVAQRFKEGWWRYRINEENEKVGHLLTEDHYSEVSTNVMVEYNEYIESQFTQEISIRVGRDYHEELDESEWIIKSARMALDSYEKERTNSELRSNDPYVTIHRIDKYQTIIDDFLRQLSNISNFTLQGLVYNKWQPKAIGQDLSRWFSQMFYREFGPFPRGKERFHDKEFEHFMINVVEDARMAFNESLHYVTDDMLIQDRTFDKLLFSGSAALSIGIRSYWGTPFEKEMSRMSHFVGQLCAIEIENWGREINKSDDSIAMFLANTNFQKDSLQKIFFRKMMPPPIRYAFEKDGRGIKRFCEAFAKAQARILDLDQDVRFLISIIENALRQNRKQGLLPYIEGVAKKVIVNKKLSHEKGLEECKKGFNIADSLEQFEQVLANILKKWEM